ncbi:MAG: methyltransferase domain-containing protein, partial [Desulfobacteraceae bacterium]
RLVAYVVPPHDLPETHTGPADTSSTQVEQWQFVWDGIYTRLNEAGDPTSNFNGWNSSYTGKPIPNDEMQAWLNNTVNRILQLQPKRILEIGCGVGLLLYRIAPHCEAYAASDFSNEALQMISEQMARKGLGNVNLFHNPADDFRIFDHLRFDVAVLNSVVQYFPSRNYLMKILDELISRIAEGGKIFIGDVRNLALLDAFYWDILRVTHGESLPPIDQRRYIAKRRIMESELAIDPAFFLEMKQRHPRVCHVSLCHKQGEHHNELTKFRYDVVLYLDTADAIPPDSIKWFDWLEHESPLEMLTDILADPQSGPIGVRRIPNARIQRAVRANRLLKSQNGPSTPESFRREWSKEMHHAADPEIFRQLGAAHGWVVDVGFNADEPDFLMDVIFQRLHDEKAHPIARMPISEMNVVSKPVLKEYTTDPARAAYIVGLPQTLRTALQAHLQEYMVPAAFVVLDSLPLTPNGKVDRKALPAPEYQTPAATYVAPHTPTEEALVKIFGEVLAMERVGVNDNFFDMGGNSLSIVRVANLINQRLKMEILEEISVITLFQYPTISSLGEYLKLKQNKTNGSDAESEDALNEDRIGLDSMLKNFNQEN